MKVYVDYDASVLAVIQKTGNKQAISQQFVDYADRTQLRKSTKRPAVAVVGYSRSGKDSFARELCSFTDLVYGGSTSSVMAPFVAQAMSMSVEDAWETRVTNREFWFKWIMSFGRVYGRAAMTRMLLGKGDVVVGIRSMEEFNAALSEKLFSKVYWVDRGDKQADDAMSLTKEYVLASGGTLINNNGEYAELQQLAKEESEKLGNYHVATTT